MMANYNVGTDYDVGSDPALIPMHRMASRAHPINPSTSYSQGNLDVSGYSWNQPQRTSSSMTTSSGFFSVQVNDLHIYSYAVV